MGKLLILGIDGMDPDVIETLIDDLPIVRELIEHNCFTRLNSTFPPDSIPAWVSIYTGENPIVHGWLDNIDYEEIKKGRSPFQLNEFQGKTFWDKASKSGKRVCIINPFLAYPVWPVNGVMINGPVFINGEISCYPPELKEEYQFPQLGGMTDFPDEKELFNFGSKTIITTKQIADFALDLYKKDNWDLFFVSFFTVDRMQHFLWRYFDKNDPTYPGENNLSQYIPDLYRTIDSIIADFVESMGPTDSLLILSDHGHGMRPLKQININEVLRLEKYLFPLDEKKKFQLRKYIEKTKNLFLEWLSDHKLESISYVIGKLLPKKVRRDLKKSSYLIDKVKSKGWVSDFGGGTSMGGVEINPQIKLEKPELYKKIREDLILNLSELKDGSGKKVVKWIRSSGNDVCEKYPDLIFELEDQFAVGRTLFSGVISKNPRHIKISGGHKPQGVLFYKSNIPLNVEANKSVLNIHDLVIKTLEG